MKFKHFLVLLFILLIGVRLKSQDNYFLQWPQFRGPFASGIVETNNLPDNWDMTSGKNIKWKTEIPGLGHSSPIIWDEQIFVTTAVNTQASDSLKVGVYGDVANYNDSVVKEFRLICINKKNGTVLWNELVHKGIPKTKRHTKASHADPTPATNGEYVLAFFGSNGLFCYTVNGAFVWKMEFEKMNAGYYYTPEMEWNVSSSPILHENTAIIQCDNLNNGFLMAIDIKTGEVKWRVARSDVSTYSVPNFYKKDDKKQIIVNGYKQIGAYDFNTGDEIWNMSGGGDIPVPTPIFGHDLIYIHSAHGKSSPIYAIKPNAQGDITLDKDSTSNKYITWSINRGGAYIPTALIYGEYLYNLMGINGKMTCFDAKTGQQIYQEKLPDARGITASGIASNGKLYYSTEQGDVYVVKAGHQFEILAVNTLNDIIMATPAISNNAIYFRTQHSIIAVGE